MTKFLSLLVGAPVALFSLCASVCAEYKTDENLLGNYVEILWSGDSLQYDSYSQTLSFINKGKADYNAEFIIDLPEAKAKGFMFYADLGNGQTTADFGAVTLEFLDKDGASLAKSASEIINAQTNFRRCFCGKSSEFFPVDENSASVRVTLTANDADADGKINVYFRNFCLLFSDKQIMSSVKPSEIPATMKLSDELSKVEIGNVGLSRWLWVGIIVIVAFLFYFLRVHKQKNQKSSIMKPTMNTKK